MAIVTPFNYRMREKTRKTNVTICSRESADRDYIVILMLFFIDNQRSDFVKPMFMN